MKSVLVVTAQRRPKLSCGPRGPIPTGRDRALRGARHLTWYREVGLQLHFPLTYIVG